MIDGDIAGIARDLVAKEKQPDAEHRNETAYRALCEGLPILLRTAGLARTLAYLSAKANGANEHARLLGHLQKQLLTAGIYTNGEKRTLALDEWASAKQRKTKEYLHVSRLTFRVAYWHKRLAQALLRKKGEA